MLLAMNVGLEDLVEKHLRVAANPGMEIGSLVAGLVAGADALDADDARQGYASPEWTRHHRCYARRT